MADSGTYDEATLARRYAMAQKLLTGDKPPIRNWAEGLASMAESALGGYQFSKAEAERKAEKEQGTADLYKAYGLQPPAVAPAAPEGGFQKLAALLQGTPSAAPAAAPIAPGGDQASYPPPAAPGPPPTTFRPGITAPAPPVTAGGPDYGKAIAGIESGGAYDKLGPQTKTGDRAFGKYQVMGNNIPEWTTQVLGKPMTPEQFLANPDAQEAVFKAKFGDYVQKYGPEGAAKAWFAGEKGMNNPGAKDVLGTTVASYGQKFTNALGPSPQVAAALTAGAPTDVSAAAKPPAVSTTSGILQGIPDEKKAQIVGMLASRNPQLRALGQALQTQALAASDTPKFDFKTAGDSLYRTNARTGTAEPIRDTGRGVKPMTPEQRKEWNVPEGMSAGIDDNGKPIFSPPGTNINLNTAQAGSKAMQAKAVEDFQGVQEASRAAVKRSPIWDQMEQASKGFTPGATAEMKLTAGRYLKDLGLSAGEGVPDAEVFKQLQQQIAIHAQPKGQGGVSNAERELFAKAIPNIEMSPEALQRSIKISRSLDEYDRKAAQIYRDNAKKNGGIPDSIEVNQEIEKLGAPLSTAETSFLQKAGAGTTEAAKPAAAPKGVPPGALEEARRRGLIK